MSDQPIDVRGVDVPVTAGEALTSYQFRIVYISAARTVKLCGTTAYPAGIIQDTPANGKGGNMRITGVSYCEAGAVVSVGYPIGPDSVGRGIHATADGYMIGVSLTAAGAAGQYFSVVLGARAAAN